MGKCSLSIRILTICGVVSFIVLFTACGSSVDVQDSSRTIGIDGYVYVAEKISGDEIIADGSQASVLLDGEAPQTPEVSFYPSNIYVKDGEGNFYFLSCNYRVTDSPGSILDGALDIYVPGIHYTVYSDGSLQTVKTGKGERESLSVTSPDEKGLAEVRALAHTIIYKTSPQGEILYELDLTDHLWGRAFSDYYTCLAVHKSGTLMLLLEDGILLVDGEGHTVGTVDTETVLDADFPEEYSLETQYLTGSMDGRVYYYVERNGSHSEMAVYEVEEKGTFALSRVEAFRGKGSGELYPGLEGILFDCHAEGILYRYSRDGGLVPILRWQDSNLNGNNVREVVQVSGEELLVDTLRTSMGLATEHVYYLLKRTAVGELPEKEVVVLVSRYPDGEILQAMAEFNAENLKYHVTLGNYGWDSDYSSALARLDADLTGSDPPDILNMSGFDFYKYAEKGALEDLGGCLEGSSLVHREDFLENVLDAYTVDGRLLCIPRDFSVMTVLGRKSQLGEISGWNMEKCMELTELYPEYCLIAGWDAQMLLTSFCRAYCLERFVDWAGGTCSFNSDEFKEMLVWLKGCGEKSSGLKPDALSRQRWQASLLTTFSLNDAAGLVRKEFDLGEKTITVGYPTENAGNLHLGEERYALAMVSGSAHKEGAWAFLEYFLSREREIPLDYPFFPVNKKEFQELMEYYTTPGYWTEENGERLKDLDDKDQMRPKIWLSNTDPVYYLEEEQAAEVLKVIETADFTPEREGEGNVMEIVAEEAAFYFDGTKKVDEVAEIIQNRVSLLVNEGM